MVVEERRTVTTHGRVTISVTDLETRRRSVVAAVGAVEARLGHARMKGKRLRRGGLVALNLKEREAMKQHWTTLVAELRTINAAIKAGRRSGMLLLLTGQDRPTNERELVATLYRLFTDAVPPADQDDHQRGLMILARDFVMTGPSAFEVQRS